MDAPLAVVREVCTTSHTPILKILTSAEPSNPERCLSVLHLPAPYVWQLTAPLRTGVTVFKTITLVDGKVQRARREVGHEGESGRWEVAEGPRPRQLRALQIYSIRHLSARSGLVCA
jgi:hypothetical protein